MHTRYIPNPKASGVCLHNTQNWQVTEHLGGLGCELLAKERVISVPDGRRLGLSLHDCYPSAFMQGDEALEFLGTLATAQGTCSDKEIDALLLEGYRPALI